MNGIEQAFHEGGWGMWPTLILGTLALALAIRHAVAPNRALLPLLIGMGAATLFSGVLGLTMGLIRTFAYIHQVEPKEQLPIAFAGAAESLHNLALALILGVLLALVASVGSYRDLLARRA